MNGTSDSRIDKRNRNRKAIKTGCPVCGLHNGCNKRRSTTGRKNKETK